MKKLVLAAAIGLFSLPAFAQTMTVNAGRTTFGIRAGVNFQNINGEDRDGDELENHIQTGFHAGINAEVPIGTGFYVQPGLLYSLKGAESENSTNKVHLSYVEVPINLVYKPILGTGNMVLGFGPYVGIGVGGNVETNGTKRDIEFVSDYEAGNAAPQFKRLDAGANFLAGYEFANKLSFQLNAQLGLVNINPEISPNDDSKLRNTGFGVSLGYRF
jgi:opacity protein-like surface antigen